MVSQSPRPNHFPMNTRLLALALVSTSLSVASAAQDTIFSTILPPPGTGALDVVPTEGGVLVGGATTTNAGFTAQSYEAIAVRFDASGGLVWNRVIPDSRSRIIAVERTSSGGYVELQAFVSGGYTCSIRDAAGALGATVDLDPASMADDEVTSFVGLEDGTFALGGRLGQGTGGRESHLLIFDDAGSRLTWYPPPAAARAISASVVP